ncbi:MAG TPA: ATP-binding protein [Bacteroidia bacterium]|nr:ATP-binding protein [Bacteroidia bacterium]
MNYRNLKKISFLTSLSISAVIGLLILIFDFVFQRQEIYLLLLFIVLVTLLISYFLAYFFFRKYLHQNVSTIYQTIQSVRKKKFPNDPFYSNQELLQNLHNEVLDWVNERKMEMEQLHKLELYRKEFLGNVSHELKTPIFNIQGYISTLLDGAMNDPKTNHSFLLKADRSVERLIHIVEDLEAISQLETGDLRLDPERFDITELVRDVLEAEEMQASSKNIVLTMKETKPLFVNADKFRIRQVFTNLIVNSIKYGKENGETIVRFYEHQNQIVAEVSDNGIGIPEIHLSRLFERFYRVDKSRSRDQGGTGLGLSIVKHILEAHGQTISVDSTEGIGSLFSFTLKKER